GLYVLDEFESSSVAAVLVLPWPCTAALAVSFLWIARGKCAGVCPIDGNSVSSISSTLSESSGYYGPPRRLWSNRDIAAKGSSIQGVGFLMPPQDAERIKRTKPHEGDVLFPFLGGNDITSTVGSAPTRWVINFFDWPLQTAERYPVCLSLVREKVKPEREKAAERNAIGARRAKYWWKYDAQARELYERIRNFEYVWVC